jgi:hypothetical protein
LWLILFVAVLALGTIVVGLGPASAALFLPPLHFLGALLPALAVIGMASWRRGGAAWRPTLVGLAYGGCAATSLAMVVEATVGAFLLVGILGTTEGQRLVERLPALMQELQGGSVTAESLSSLTPLLLTPVIVAAAFGLIGLAGPLVEELGKAAGVALAGPIDASQAWLWGVTIGAGFGMAEALTFSAMGVGLPDWPQNMLVRALATVMHATMGGIGGLGIYYLTVGRRSGRGLGLIGLAWLGHSAWNSAVLLASFGGMAASAPDAPAWTRLTVAAGVFGVIFLLGWVLLTLRGVSAATARAAAMPATPPPGPPAPPLPPADTAIAVAAPAVLVAADDAWPPDEPAPGAAATGEASVEGTEAGVDDAAGPATADTTWVAPGELDVDAVEDPGTDPGSDEGIPGLGIDAAWRPLTDDAPGEDPDAPRPGPAA